MDDTPAEFDLAALAAAEFHELKNQISELAFTLDEVGSRHPGAAADLIQVRLDCRSIMERLVQILTLYKNGQQALQLNVEAHSPSELIEELVADCRGLARNGVVIEAETGKAPPFAFFDRYLAHIAMLNAVHNALRFARARIVVGVEAQAGGLNFYVRDDSEGYPSHILENQGHRPGRSASGTGLGLFFAQTIARAHVNGERRGELRLENKGGACFSLWLP